MKYKILLSIFCFAWIIFMSAVHYFKLDIGTFGGVLWEMLTIPVFVLIPVQIIVYFVFWVKKKFSTKCETFYALLLNLLSAAFIAFFLY